MSQLQYMRMLTMFCVGCFSLCLTGDQYRILLFYGKLLLSAGAAVNTVDPFGWTALIEAADIGLSDITEVGSQMSQLQYNSYLDYVFNGIF